MEDTLITYPTAILAKEKGFNIFDEKHMFVFCECEPESYFYHKPVQNNHCDSYNNGYLYRAPTQSFLAKWLREVHLIYVSPFNCSYDMSKWSFELVFLYGGKYFHGMGNKVDQVKYNSYDEALEAGLIAALKLIVL